MPEPLAIPAASHGTGTDPIAEDTTDQGPCESTMAQALDALAEITDETDTEDLWTEGMRDIDAQRPAGQKLFEGMY